MDDLITYDVPFYLIILFDRKIFLFMLKLFILETSFTKSLFYYFFNVFVTLKSIHLFRSSFIILDTYPSLYF